MTGSHKFTQQKLRLKWKKKIIVSRRWPTRLQLHLKAREIAWRLIYEGRFEASSGHARDGLMEGKSDNVDSVDVTWRKFENENLMNVLIKLLRSSEAFRAFPQTNPTRCSNSPIFAPPNASLKRALGWGFGKCMRWFIPL
jgi:hypothetical protein